MTAFQLSAMNADPGYPDIDSTDVSILNLIAFGFLRFVSRPTFLPVACLSLLSHCR